MSLEITNKNFGSCGKGRAVGGVKEARAEEPEGLRNPRGCGTRGAEEPKALRTLAGPAWGLCRVLGPDTGAAPSAPGSAPGLGSRAGKEPLLQGRAEIQVGHGTLC